MMSKFKRWLCQKFLPAYCRDGLTEENEALRVEIERQRQQIARLNAYIDGVETALRYQRRVVVRNEVKRE